MPTYFLNPSQHPRYLSRVGRITSLATKRRGRSSKDFRAGPSPCSTAQATCLTLNSRHCKRRSRTSGWIASRNIRRRSHSCLSRTFMKKTRHAPNLSPDEVVAALPANLLSENAGTTKATIQFDLSGKAGGKWWAKIHDGTAEVGKGELTEVANLTLLADAGDWVRIMTGELDGTSAFMQGKLRLKGDRE